MVAKLISTRRPDLAMAVVVCCILTKHVHHVHHVFICRFQDVGFYTRSFGVDDPSHACGSYNAVTL